MLKGHNVGTPKNVKLILPLTPFLNENIQKIEVFYVLHSIHLLNRTCLEPYGPRNNTTKWFQVEFYVFDKEL